MCEENATHNIPRELQQKLVEAKKWYDEREAIPLGYGMSLTPRWDDSDQDAIPLLQEIVELCDEAWGFAMELEKSS